MACKLICWRYFVRHLAGFFYAVVVVPAWCYQSQYCYACYYRIAINGSARICFLDSTDVLQTFKRFYFCYYLEIYGMPQRSKSSSVWQHYLLEGSDTTVCRHCKIKLSYCNSTTNLMRHLKVKHLNVKLLVDDERDHDKDADKSVEPPAKQQKLTTFVK